MKRFTLPPIILLLLLGWTSRAQLPAFPGAEGFGAYATGGRGGDVYTVVNLNSSGAGSFAEGLATAPATGRTIVFAVSGHIHVNKTRLSADNVTIAGQTAPGDGICLKDGPFIVDADNVVIRHVRFRYDGSVAGGGDCINVEAGVNGLMLDHLSVMYSTDENISSFSENPRPDQVTFQWSLNAWGLESHSCGGLWDVERVTTHHTLWAHNHTRNPKARPDGLLDWINNVTFDWDIGFILGDSETPANWRANVIGNYFVCPPGNLRPVALEKARIDRNGDYNFTLHVDDNLFDKNGNDRLDGADYGYGIASGDYRRSAVPIVNGSPVPVSVDDPLTAYKKIVSGAGVLRLDAAAGTPLRDDVDAILVGNLAGLRADHISSPSQSGGSNGGYAALNGVAAPTDSDGDGMPDAWERATGANPYAANHNDPVPAGAYLPNVPAGYTRLEEYLHFLAIPHAAIPKSTAANPSFLTVDLRRFTAGFTTAPVVFTLANARHGSAAVLSDGSTVRFEPEAGFSGRAGVDFTVTDGDGSSWTQTLAVLVRTDGAPANLVWRGDGVGNVWDGSAPTFRDGADPAVFAPGDLVRFDDTGSRSPPVQIGGALAPGGVEVATDLGYLLAGAGALVGGMALVKTGAGPLTIANAGPNTFSGGTIVSNGTLRVDNATGSGTGTGAVRIAAGATLSGIGIVGGATTIGAGAILSPGGGVGALTFTAGLTLDAGTGLAFELGAASDRVAVTGDLFAAGTLDVTDAGGFGPGVYVLFTVSVPDALTPGTLSLGDLPAGYAYDIDTTHPGEVRLVVAAPGPVGIGSLAGSGGHWVASGTGGVPFGPYYLLGTEDVRLPLAGWDRIATNRFDAAGAFSLSHAAPPGAGRYFYCIEAP